MIIRTTTWLTANKFGISEAYARPLVHLQSPGASEPKGTHVCAN
jgi:hypothetical protein